MQRRLVWLSLGIGLLLFFVLLHSLNWREALDLVLLGGGGSRKYLYLYLIVSIVIVLGHTLRWYVVLRSKGIEIPFLRALGYRYASYAVSFVTPGPKVGGEPVRASLLTRHRTKKGRRIRFAEALSLGVADRATEVQAFAVMFFIGVLTLAALGELPLHLRFLLIALSTVFLLLIVYFVLNTMFGKPILLQLVKKLPLKAKMRRELAHFETSVVSFYRKEPGAFVLAHIIAAFAWLLALLEYKYLLLFLGLDVPLWAVFIIYSSVGLAYMVPVPLALGVLEGVQAATFTLLGLTPGAGILLALITRSRDVLFTIIGFMALIYYGISAKHLQKTVR
jgi:glycosyltransferase 2 family protein